MTMPGRAAKNSTVSVLKWKVTFRYKKNRSINIIFIQGKKDQIYDSGKSNISSGYFVKYWATLAKFDSL